MTTIKTESYIDTFKDHLNILLTSLPDDNVDITGLVFKTKKNIFKILKGNRKVLENKKKNVLHSMKQGVMVNPIVVNEFMEIIDGQTRYYAWLLDNKNKEPEDWTELSFIITPGLTADDAQNCNNASSSKWSFNDYIESCCVHSPYAKDFNTLKELIDDYTVPESSVLAIAFGTLDNSKNGYCNKLIRNYRYFRISEKQEEIIRRNLDKLQDIDDTIKVNRVLSLFKHDIFLNAIYWLITKENFNPERFIEGFNYLGKHKNTLNQIPLNFSSQYENNLKLAIYVYNLSPGKKKDASDDSVNVIYNHYLEEKNKRINKYKKIIDTFDKKSK